MENWLLGTSVVGGLFILRIGVPFAVIAFIVYALHHWEMSRWSTALHRWEAHPAGGAIPDPAFLKTLTQPCPAEKGRNGQRKASSHAPCWVMRRQREGVVVASCLHCERYMQTQALESLV
jgi:hypothetical protein